MRILGLDPGTALMGWAVVDARSPDPRLVQYGCIRTEAHQPLTRRLPFIFSELKRLFQEYRPTVMAVETLFFAKNAKTLAQVGHARGVALLAAGEAGVDVFEYAPREVKMALTGYGGAEKRQMQLMVQRILGLPDIPRPDDAADAVAIALCHGQVGSWARRAVGTV